MGFIRILDTAIGGSSICNSHGTSFTLDGSGGSFNIKSRAQVGTLGQQITAFGLTATITDWGKTLDTSGIFYNTSGIFGTPQMNKAFDIVTYSNRESLQFLGANNLFSLPTSGTNTTVSGMARAIAATCGVSLAWLVPDAPYTDTLGQSGLTGLEALSSLAGQVGASLRWNGTNSYIVAYPNFYAGNWNILDARLARSITYNNHLDLGLGVTGTGVIGIPINTYFDRAAPKPVEEQPGGQTTSFEIIANVVKPFKEEDPPLIRDLPDDTSSIKIQILVSNVGGGSGQYMTSDNTVWYDLGGLSIGNRYVRFGEFGKKQLWVDHTLFPNLSSINNGNFVMSFAIERTSIQPAFEEAKADRIAALREIQAKMQANNRFIKTFSATIGLDFFGSIPLPGMYTGINYCGHNIGGIIESVTVNNMESMSVEIAQYLRVNFLDRKLEWEYTLV